MAVYVSQNIAAYNASPPPDDGTQVMANRVTWSTQKSKLADPIKTLAENINTAIVAAFGTTFGAHVVTPSGNFSVATADQGTLFLCPNTLTVNLPTAVAAGGGFLVGFISTGAATITINCTGGDTLNGLTSFTMNDQYRGAWVISDGTSKWYFQCEVRPASTQAETVAGSAAGRTVTPYSLAALWQKNISTTTATASLALPVGGYHEISATDTVTALSNADPAGRRVLLRFNAQTKFTHNASSLILFGSADITFQAGDLVEFICETGSANWRMLSLRGSDGRTWPRYYNSGEQAVTASTLLELSHGLGVIPKEVIVSARMVAATATLGFAPNEEVRYFSATGTTISVTATGVRLAQAAVPLTIISAATLGAIAVTATNWRWVVVALG